ncbi:hypothetical protein SS50377_21987 [Spironucleus salmonicida]|uniref:Uncharacterized protein n=1 Tax=Spironucleus salmonicida TaxID=348837 RepID=V6LTK4_9EUKA|nr:hypothetical protein SS50377_21987 [Spironucleus salmonicida]|eukprot:EST47026.1 Hypothetical protein SS50377_12982 [Spironucleus salmonicida]
MFERLTTSQLGEQDSLSLLSSLRSSTLNDQQAQKLNELEKHIKHLENRILLDNKDSQLMKEDIIYLLADRKKLVVQNEKLSKKLQKQNLLNSFQLTEEEKLESNRIKAFYSSGLQ